MIDIGAMRNESYPTYLYNLVLEKIRFMKEHPDYFHADGLSVFVGPQGSGKTLSAVNYVYKLMNKYKKAILVTNIYLTDFPFDNVRVFPFKNADDLTRYSNGEYGVIFLIDEIQLYFNSLESKNINPEVMVQISQQRKQRKHIVCTSQVFGRMAKPLREQFSTVILCKCYFKFLQKNMMLDRDSMDGETSSDTTISGKVKHSFWWVHHPKYYKRYDTYYTIARNKFITNEKKVGNIYESRMASDN